MKIKLNKSIVAIHSHICGDGNMYVKLEKRSPSSIRTSRTKKPFKRYIIEYTNTNPRLLNLMTNHIKSIFPKTYVYRSNKKHRIQARNKELFLIIKSLGYPNGNNWTIPDEISINSNFRKIWLRAFFDDEGSVYSNALLCYNTNKKAMLIIQKMLELEGFKTKISKRIPKNKKHKICYTIRIPASSFLLFKKIGFNHTVKKRKYSKFYKLRMRRLGFEPR